MFRIVATVLVVVVAAVGFLGVRWYTYVSNTETPYDEVGIGINSRLPAPLNRWGCAKLQDTFATALPPYGCAGPDGTTWRN